ncbi:MAG: glycosyltransferase [Acidobacteriia bacterium]|nr:glycosyltransferase [Terriglobia bacterium]
MGLSNYIAELVPELCDAGQQVTVLATNCAYRGAPADEIVSIDRRCTLMLFPSTGRLNRRVYHSAGLSAWLRQNVRQFDVVDIQGLWFWTTVHAARACIAGNVPYVITPHGMMGRWDWAKRPLAKRIFFRTMLAKVWRSASAVRYLSLGEMNNSMVVPAAPAAIIPAAITMPAQANPDSVTRLKARLNIFPAAPLVLFLGRVNPQKGVLELVQAFDLVHQRCPDAVLVVAGGLEGKYGDEVQAVASTVRSHTHIRILGRVSAEDKASLLAAASVFVTLSRNEGMSSAILEALGQGVPAVCTTDSNLPEIDEYAAGIVTKLDPAKAADAIAGLLENDQQRHTMGANARRMVSEHFTWNSVVPQLTALYERLAYGRVAVCQPGIQRTESGICR